MPSKVSANPMLVSKSVRCEQCGYENDGRYRFCGMCGAKLPAPEPIVAARPEEPPPARQEPVSRPVSGPSFLGLADENASNVSYLLEDEVSSSHRGRLLVLLLFIGIGIGAWHWRHDWRVLLARAANVANGQGNAQTANNNLNTANNNAAPAPTSASPSEVAPAMGMKNEASPAKPMTGVGDQPSNPPAASGDNKVASSSAPSETARASDNQAASAAPATNSQKDESTTSKSGKAASNSSSESDDEVAYAKTPARPQKPSAEEKTVADTSSAGDALESQGEKYLYGNGVPANCDRAQRSLVEAANQANTKADTVLGTMYATGHCTARDLPLAYRWFARALDQEPGNARYQRDLEVLWNQMSPDEKKMATQRQ